MSSLSKRPVSKGIDDNVVVAIAVGIFIFLRHRKHKREDVRHKQETDAKAMAFGSRGA